MELMAGSSNHFAPVVTDGSDGSGSGSGLGSGSGFSGLSGVSIYVLLSSGEHATKAGIIISANDSIAAESVLFRFISNIIVLIILW